MAIVAQATGCLQIAFSSITVSISTIYTGAAARWHCWHPACFVYITNKEKRDPGGAMGAPSIPAKSNGM
jgi:hypothetical protein